MTICLDGYSLIFGFVMFLLISYGERLWTRYKVDRANRIIEAHRRPCVHGYLDWDSCPDCRH
jgi:hypothetical protein